MQIEHSHDPITGYTPFALGFRPFFWAAGVWALIVFPFWLSQLGQTWLISPYYADNIAWHRHEMLFGYVMAVIAGFLLTAVKNWTHQPTPSGTPLALLFLLWLAARIAPLFELPTLITATLDLLFVPLLAWLIALPIWRSRQHNNQVFPLLLLLIGGANLFIHLGMLGVIETDIQRNNTIAALLMLWILVIMAGRVVPFFIERATQDFKRKSWRMIEFLSPATLALLIFAQLTPNPTFISLAALFAAVVHLIRLMGWYTHQLWREPLIWVLWLGYLWLVIGFALHALALHGVMPLSWALHAYFTGALGVLSLGMMARVAVGHTGREMRLPHSAMIYAFVLINLAALIRVFAPLLPLSYNWPIGFATAAWCLSFLIFIWFYTPILLKARIDGRPG